MNALPSNRPSVRHFVQLAALAGAVLLLLPGCTSKWRLDDAVAERILDRVAEDWPMCGTPATDAAAAARDARSAGTCGGELTAISEHENGDTDWVVTLDGFCLESDDGPVTLDGVAHLLQDGTPSDVGPVLDATEASTDGAVEMEHDGKTVEVSLAKARIEYGYPDVTPGVPDEDNPDVVTVDRVDFVHRADDGRQDFIRNVEINRWGPPTESTIEVLQGQSGTEGDGFVEIRTPADEPIVMNVRSLELLSGALELQGAGDTVIVVRPDLNRPGVFTLTLNSSDMEREVDCGDATAPLVAGMLAFLVEVPIF